MRDYIVEALDKKMIIPELPFEGECIAQGEQAQWVVCWGPELSANDLLTESYVNLIPTVQGGTHINGLRTGLIDGMKEFCEFHHLLPKGIKINADDLMLQCNYVLSLKIKEPQFSGQTKERLTSRQSAAFIMG